MRLHIIHDIVTGDESAVPFAPSEEAAADAAAAAAASPAAFPLSRRQVRKAMVFAGIGLDTVGTVIAAMPAGEARDLARIDWEDAPIYLRSHPMFDALAPAVGVTPQQLDSLWLWAANLDP